MIINLTPHAIHIYKEGVLFKTIEQFCDQHNACHAGRRWALAHCHSMRHAWDTARPEWVVWIATRPGVMTQRECVQFALWCADRCARPNEDARVTACRDTVRRWLDGDATSKDCHSAYAAYAAADAAAYAAYAAAYAAYAAAAAYAAYAAADAAYAYAYAYAAADADAADASNQAAWLRKNIIPNF